MNTCYVPGTLLSTSSTYSLVEGTTKAEFTYGVMNFPKREVQRAMGKHPEGPVPFEV